MSHRPNAQPNGNPRKIIPPLRMNESRPFSNDEIETAHRIRMSQLKNSKIYSHRSDYILSLPRELDYVEVGVAWGGYSEELAEKLNPASITLIDLYNQDHMCWSLRFRGECTCETPHGLYTKETHEAWVREHFSRFRNVNVIKGSGQEVLPTLNKEYDYIYIDVDNGRETLREMISKASKKVKVGGIIGVNDYVIYDGIIDHAPYGSFQSVNEFLFYNENWEVDAIALHEHGFYDIYLRRIA